MAYEEFTLRRCPRDIPMVSILKHGIISLNQACYYEYFKSYKYVVFLFDRENNKIALKLTNDAKDNVYNIRVTRNGRLASISASAFLKYYKIPHPQTKAYSCSWNEEQKILEVQL